MLLKTVLLLLHFAYHYKFKEHFLLKSGWNYWLLCSNNVAHSNTTSLMTKMLPVLLILLLRVTACMSELISYKH